MKSLQGIQKIFQKIKQQNFQTHKEKQKHENILHTLRSSIVLSSRPE